jgi:tetrapyrrole methylase family protein/MazG family protein
MVQSAKEIRPPGEEDGSRHGLPMEDSVKEFKELVDIMARLRGPDGCPWDREQTVDTLKVYLVEETYEVLEALETGNDRKTCEELGDLLLQVLFLSILFEEQGKFGIVHVIEGIKEKLIRRHPHVFGDAVAKTPKEVLVRWEQLKRREDGETRRGLLQGLPVAMPSLLKAFRICERVSTVGFDWESPEKVLVKIQEEKQELESTLKENDPVRTEEEIGDLLFSVAALARKLEINPEAALQKSTEKFRRRFRAVEEALQKQGKSLDKATLAEMDELWDEAKRDENRHQRE